MEFQHTKRTLSGGDKVVLTKRMIMKTAAGYYVGRYCKTVESKDPHMLGCIEPYNRLGCHSTREAAEWELQLLKEIE